MIGVVIVGPAVFVAAPSRQHGLRGLYLVLAADITGASNGQKVRGLASRISAMNDR